MYAFYGVKPTGTSLNVYRRNMDTSETVLLFTIPYIANYYNITIAYNKYLIITGTTTVGVEEY